MSTSIYANTIPAGPLVYVAPAPGTSGAQNGPALGGLTNAAWAPAPPPSGSAGDHMMLAGRYPVPAQGSAPPTALAEYYRSSLAPTDAQRRHEQQREVGLGVAIGICAMSLAGGAGFLIHDIRKSRTGNRPDSQRFLLPAKRPAAT